MERLCNDSTRGNGFKLEEVDLHSMKREEMLYYEGAETLELVAQRSCGCPTPRSVQRATLNNLIE